MSDHLNPAYADPIDASLVAEAAQYAWTPEPVHQADPRLHPDHRPTAVQLRDAQADADRYRADYQNAAALVAKMHAAAVGEVRGPILGVVEDVAAVRADRQQAMVDAEVQRHKQVHWLHLLKQIGQTLGAGETDLEELPALVDGLRTTTDQLRIQAADHVHALNRAEAGATFWKTGLVRETNQLRDLLHKARLTTAQAEARAGAYLLAHDHLDAVTRTLVATIHQHVARSPEGIHCLTPNDRDRILTATDTVHDALSRDLESYLAEPYDDITPDTRVDLTPAGLAVTAAASCPYCLSTDPYRRNAINEGDGPAWCDNDWHDSADDTQELPPRTVDRCATPGHVHVHPETITTDNGCTLIPRTVAAASVPRVARESDHWACWRCGYQNAGPVCTHCGWTSSPARTDRALETIGVVGDIVAARLSLLGEVDYPDGTTRLLAGMADDARRDRQHAETRGGLSWLDLLAEAYWSAMVEQDPAGLRPALVRMAAYAVAWAEAIDRRPAHEDQAEVQA